MYILIAIVRIYMWVLYPCLNKRSNQYKLNLIMLTNYLLLSILKQLNDGEFNFNSKLDLSLLHSVQVKIKFLISLSK